MEPWIEIIRTIAEKHNDFANFMAGFFSTDADLTRIWGFIFINEIKDNVKISLVWMNSYDYLLP